MPGLEYHDSLNPALWDGDQLRADVHAHLLAIANRFIGSFDAPVNVTTIVLTGSNANYNWTARSDLDVHVIYDPRDRPWLPEYLLDKKRLFNSEHDVRIKGYNVEVYPQSTTEAFYGAGVYSLDDGAWLKHPAREPPDVDEAAVDAKVSDFARKIELAIAGACDVNEVQEQVHRLRLAGLEHGGELSVENIAFKELRAAGLLDRLAQAGRQREDRRLSLDRRTKTVPHVHVHIHGNKDTLTGTVRQGVAIRARAPDAGTAHDPKTGQFTGANSPHHEQATKHGWQIHGVMEGQKAYGRIGKGSTFYSHPTHKGHHLISLGSGQWSHLGPSGSGDPSSKNGSSPNTLRKHLEEFHKFDSA